MTIAQQYAERARKALAAKPTMALLSEYGRLERLVLDIQRLACRDRNAGRRMSAQWTRAHRQFHAIAVELGSRGYDRDGMSIGGAAAA